METNSVVLSLSRGRVVGGSGKIHNTKATLTTLGIVIHKLCEKLCVFIQIRCSCFVWKNWYTSTYYQIFMKFQEACKIIQNVTQKVSRMQHIQRKVICQKTKEGSIYSRLPFSPPLCGLRLQSRWHLVVVILIGMF